MSCRRSQEIDLPAFLAEPRDGAFEEFRLHYPGCRDCSTEVRAWTELHEALAARHPEPEVLARYGALSEAERASIDRHTARCPSCREELAGLAAFDPGALRAAAATPEPAPSWLARLRHLLAPAGRVLWHPAFAYALVALLLLPVVQRLGAPDEPIAERLFADAPARSREAAPEARAPSPDVAPGGAGKQEPAAAVALPSAEADEAAPKPQQALRALGYADTKTGRADVPAPSELARRVPATAGGLAPRADDAHAGARLAEESTGDATSERDVAEREPQAFFAPEAPAPRAAPSIAGAPARRKSRLTVPEDTEGERLESANDVRARVFRSEAAQGLAEASRGEGLLAAAKAPAAAGVLRLEPRRTAELRLPGSGELVEIRVPGPARPPAEPVWIRIRDTRGRELRQPLSAREGQAGVLTARIPRAWLLPGDYGAQLEGDDSEGVDSESYAFRVR